MSGHTKGPWACDRRPVFGSWYVRQDPANWDGNGYQFICELPADKKGTHYGDMFAANASLIAAAPDLLDALEQAVDALSRCYNVCDWPADGQTIQDKAIRSGEAAISKAKAEGTRP